jgi:predicted RNA methylase
MTNVGIYSGTGVRGSQFIINKIMKFVEDKNITITDGTGNIGTDTIMFANTFKKVNSVEIDNINYDVLKNNINEYNFNNVDVYNGDINKIIQQLKQDVIYIDAPWGGTDHKKNKNINLYLGKIEISYFYLNNKNRAKLFVFKVPLNYNINYFIRNVTSIENSIHIYRYYNNKNKPKFSIIIIKN